jgi:hypothetical protein
MRRRGDGRQSREILRVKRLLVLSGSAPETARVLRENSFTPRGEIAMPMAETDIQPGKCYATGGRENYKVLHINRGIVSYLTWNKGGKMQPLRTNAGVKAFAAAVTKEIACPAEG